MKKLIAVLLSAAIGLTSTAGFAAPAHEQQPRPAQTKQAAKAKAKKQTVRKTERKSTRKAAQKKTQSQKRYAQNTKNVKKQPPKKQQTPQSQRAAKPMQAR